MATGIQTEIVYSEHGGPSVRPVSQFIVQNTEHLGAQTVVNPNYVAPGLYTLADALKTSPDFNSADIKNSADFFNLYNKVAPVTTTPISYAGDTHGIASGGVSYFNTKQAAANRTALWQFGIGAGYIKPPKTDFLGKVIETVVPIIVVGGITGGVAAGFGAGPFAGSGASAGGTSGASLAASEGVTTQAVPNLAADYAITGTSLSAGSGLTLAEIGAGIKTTAALTGTAASLKNLFSSLTGGNKSQATNTTSRPGFISTGGGSSGAPITNIQAPGQGNGNVLAYVLAALGIGYLLLKG